MEAAAHSATEPGLARDAHRLRLCNRENIKSTKVAAHRADRKLDETRIKRGIDPAGLANPKIVLQLVRVLSIHERRQVEQQPPRDGCAR